MFHFGSININDKKEFYHQVNTCLLSMIQDEPYWLSGLANASALLYQLIPEINWAGFYLNKCGELVLGPFQGKPACIRIIFGGGVCGTAAKTGNVQIVEDVNRFPGYISCDRESQSEIVLPVFHHQRLIGVLDIDSPVKARFDQEDANGLVQFIDILNQTLKWPENF